MAGAYNNLWLKQPIFYLEPNEYGLKNKHALAHVRVMDVFENLTFIKKERFEEYSRD